MDLQIGEIIRKYRKSKNITLKELAEKTGLSIAYLSLIERDMNSPTLKNLNAICAALHTTMANLISEIDQTDNALVKKEEREIIIDNASVKYELATKIDPGMKCVVMTVKDNATHVSTSHIVDEIGFIISGSLHLTAEDREYDLNPGDCIYIKANTPHQYQKTSDETCFSVWTYNQIPDIIAPLSDNLKSEKGLVY